MCFSNESIYFLANKCAPILVKICNEKIQKKRKIENRIIMMSNLEAATPVFMFRYIFLLCVIVQKLGAWPGESPAFHLCSPSSWDSSWWQWVQRACSPQMMATPDGRRLRSHWHTSVWTELAPPEAILLFTLTYLYYRNCLTQISIYI